MTDITVPIIWLDFYVTFFAADVVFVIDDITEFTLELIVDDV